MFQATGEKHWIIPDGYIPPTSTGELLSHESICVLNTSSEEASIKITIFFEDREPIEDIEVVVAARRTNHIRTSSLRKGEQFIPDGVPYAIEVSSNIPIVVQYSRLDSTQAANTLMSTMAFPLK